MWYIFYVHNAYVPDQTTVLAKLFVDLKCIWWSGAPRTPPGHQPTISEHIFDHGPPLRYLCHLCVSAHVRVCVGGVCVCTLVCMHTRACMHARAVCLCLCTRGCEQRRGLGGTGVDEEGVGCGPSTDWQRLGGTGVVGERELCL